MGKEFLCTTKILSDEQLKKYHDLSAKDRLAVLKTARWEPGQTIYIKFLNGDRQVQQRIKKMQKFGKNLQIFNLNLVIIIMQKYELELGFRN